MDTILSVQNLNIYYRTFHALKSVSVDIPRGNIIALIGASGSGKTTFLRSLNRMLDTIPHASVTGNIWYEKTNVVAPDCDVVALRRRIGMVFQQPTPFPKSIYDNIAYGPLIHGAKRPSYQSNFTFFRDKTRHRRVRLWRKRSRAEIETSTHPLDLVVVQSLKEAALWDEVKDRLHLSAYQLSGGQQQRLCIARMLAVRPNILLLDEPCSALDPISTKKIEDLLRSLSGYTMIMVTHNLQQARRVSDFTGFFHQGELIEFAPTTDVFERPVHQLTRSYVRGEFG